jgi:hypothetical protein
VFYFDENGFHRAKGDEISEVLAIFLESEISVSPEAAEFYISKIEEVTKTGKIFAGSGNAIHVSFGPMCVHLRMMVGRLDSVEIATEDFLNIVKQWKDFVS